jgi:hypothetical protein
MELPTLPYLFFSMQVAVNAPILGKKERGLQRQIRRPSFFWPNYSGLVDPLCLLPISLNLLCFQIMSMLQFKI